MAYQYKDIHLTKLSVIGAGQIGPDICLHFAKVFCYDEVKIVLVDISEEALQKAEEKISRKLEIGLNRGKYSVDAVINIKKNMQFTIDYNDIAGSEIVLEAATEAAEIKRKIFAQVEAIVNSQCLLLSNSSHMQPEQIFSLVKNKQRCLTAHYFFPAERNPIVELIPGRDTDPTITKLLLGFYQAIGKVPIEVKSSYGYAIDPIFEGLAQMAILCLENEYGSVKEIDKVAKDTLGLGVGPFTALNLTGGNPITNHGLEQMHKMHNQWFRSPKTLQKIVEQGELWPTAVKGEQFEVSPEKEKVLQDHFLGCYFALASYIIDLGITNISDLDMAVELALVIDAPFTLMNEIGIVESHKLVRKFCDEHHEFPFPVSLDKAKRDGSWKIAHVLCEIRDKVKVLTIRRPKVLNALNLELLKEIRSEVEQAVNDPGITGIVITGFGVKAFVSGADIDMLASIKTPEDAYNNSHEFQEILNYIESSVKPVVCALNGFAFGGGNELAISCTARIAKYGLPIIACQPEVHLGFIPGAGGTQRLPRLVGVEIAAELLRTGRPVSSSEALTIGLIDREAKDDLVDEAVDFVKELVSGEAQPREIIFQPIHMSVKPKKINLGHLSKKIDDLLSEAIYKGIKLSLEEGLDLESRMFGQCILTEDMKIGLKNFRKNGPKAKAEFVHK